MRDADIGRALGETLAGYRDHDPAKAAEAMVDIVYLVRTARAEQRERDEQIALRYTGESYIAELIANAIRNQGPSDAT